MKANAKDLLSYARELADGSRARNEMVAAAQRSQDIAPYLLAQPLRVLDLANGSLRPQYLILSAQGHCVYGIDRINGTPSTPTDLAYAVARRIFAHQIRAPRVINVNRLIRGNVSELPVGDASFDLITSVAAFEHFLDVPRVLDELYRVLCRGGVIWACIHLFTSPSGGHNAGYSCGPMSQLPAGIPAWDHLRQRRIPFSVPLNEWRRDQYCAAFAKRFSILKQYCCGREGEHFLTPELEHELGAYDRDELTCAAFVIVARKDA